MLFSSTIGGKDDWARLFQSAEAFCPLIEQIFKTHGLPFSEVENCTPGTNAVFRVGSFVVKIFAPMESGFSSGEDYETERFGLSRANRIGARAPRLYAAGTIEDRYRFDYLVMEAVPGQELGVVMDRLSAEEKRRIGRELRRFVDQMDTPCEPFHAGRLRNAAAAERWTPFSPAFLREREAFLARAPRSAPVYVHGDLTCDNILITPEGELCVIDYADALTAPIEVELACVMCEAFYLEKPFLAGFFGDYDPESLAETCLVGLLLHEFGANIIESRLAAPQDVESVGALRRLLFRRLV